MNIVNVGYHSTNYYVLGDNDARLLIDAGWPGTLTQFLAALKRKDVALKYIRYLLVTHYHPDHAGLVQELKNRGIRLIVLEQQVNAIPVLNTYAKSAGHYVEIALHDNLLWTTQASKDFLKGIGIAGNIAHTPGHSDDSVTLVLDEGAAFTGDLQGAEYADEKAKMVVEQSWEAIRALGGNMVYPGHGPIRPL